MEKIALGVAYEGTHYYGWQSQPGLLTVQEILETALSQIADETVRVICAGRTDSGVHAFGQVVHFETNVKRPMKAWVVGTNALLPPHVAVKWAKSVDRDFHARFSAVNRCYRYLIDNQHVSPALFRNYRMWHPIPLNEEAMQAGANYLFGEHDFSAFRGADCQSRSTQRRVEFIRVQRDRNVIAIEIMANAFLHHMVRNVVGTLIKVGEGKETPEWVRDVLLTRDRTKAGMTVPPSGLYLMRVIYPEKFAIPFLTDSDELSKMSF